MYPSRIRLSHSTLELLHQCDRKFQLQRLLRSGSIRREDNATFSFGHGWGEGIVEYLLTGDIDSAVYRAWMAYNPTIEDLVKCEELCFHGLRKAKPKLDAIRNSWEVATFNGRPARELGYHLNINERFYYEAFIDAVLRHKSENFYSVFECKHTTQWMDDVSPMYKNSGQALGYSIVIDEIANQEIGAYALHYFVGQFKKADLWNPQIHFLPWKKTLMDRLNWFLTLGMDVARVQQMLDMNLFPMRGQSCLAFNRTCEFFGTCHMRSQDVPKTDEDIAEADAAAEAFKHPIQFKYELSEIISKHLERVRHELGTKVRVTEETLAELE